jgi:hypothetical protein
LTLNAKIAIRVRRFPHGVAPLTIELEEQVEVPHEILVNVIGH